MNGHHDRNPPPRRTNGLGPFLLVLALSGLAAAALAVEPASRPAVLVLGLVGLGLTVAIGVPLSGHSSSASFLLRLILASLAGRLALFAGIRFTVGPYVFAPDALTYEIVEGVPLRVTIMASDEPGDDGDSLQFIDRLQTNTTDPGCSAVATEDTDADGFDDAFPSVTPGTPVCWDVIPLQNDTVMPLPTPQIFEARLTVFGDGSPLDSRKVFFLIPPVIEGPGGPD